ncbi:hypothetical protein C4J81_13005 [Deltaproteobacteria bacterium Smac51]|nr:hypothetical protein C4J81_13005 [Deltaproteobacteria bacterium Smac51]
MTPRFLVFVILSVVASGCYPAGAKARSWTPSDTITVGYGNTLEVPLVTGDVGFSLDHEASAVVKSVQDAMVEVRGGVDSQLIVIQATGSNTFWAADGTFTTLDFRESEGVLPESGSIGQRDAASVFNFGDNGNGNLMVRLKDIVGGSAELATTINLYSDARLEQAWGGALTGHVNLNFMGDRFQDFDGFRSVGQADIDTLLNISGENFTPGPSGDSSTVVSISEILGGRGENFTTIIAGGAKEAVSGYAVSGPVDYVFSVQNAISGGNFEFQYNGTTAAQNNTLSIGSATDDTLVVISGSNENATVRLGTLIGGDESHLTTLVVDGQVRVTADTTHNLNTPHNNLNIINNNNSSEAVVLENVGDGVLNLGGSGSNVVLKWVNSSGTGLTINSLDNMNRATVEAASLDRYSGLSGNSKITLANATLKLAADGSGLTSASGASRFKMDSSTGNSVLDASAVTGELEFGMNQQPTIVVGSQGHVIIENRELVCLSALESRAGSSDAFDGKIGFDNAGGNRLIFLSHGINAFEGGFKIDDGRANIEFAGSTYVVGFVDSGATGLLNAGHVFFTGLNDSSDPLSASRISFGNGQLDMGQSVVHLNNSLLLIQEDGSYGGLGHISSLIMGDGADSLEPSSPASITLMDTSLSAQLAAVGQEGVRVNASMAIGGWSVMENSLNVLGTLTIGGKTVVNGHLATLSSPDSPALYFTVNQSVELTDAARFSYIDPGTIIMIDPELAAVLRDTGEGLRVLASADGATAIDPLLLAGLTANMEFNDSNLAALSGGYFDLDPFSGILSYGAPGRGLKPLPGYASSMMEAAMAHNSLLGQYIKRGPGLSARRYYKELTQIMGNTLNAALNMTGNRAREAMRRLKTFAALDGTLPSSGNAASRITDGLWLNAGYGRLTIDENYKKGYGGFKSTSGGLTLGYDLEVTRWFRAGLFVGQNTAEMKSDWQRIETDDLEAGAYGQLFLPHGFIINAAASYGWQSHTSRRDIDLRGTFGSSFNQKLKASFNGDTINAQMELARPLALNERLYLTPSAGYIYQGILLDPYLESSSIGDGPEYDLSQIAAGCDFDLHLLKVGTEVSWRGEDLSVTGRTHWLENVGDTRPESKAIFAQSADPKIFNIYGAEYDRRMINLGLGVDWSPLEGGLAVGLDYDGLLGTKTTSHSLNLNVTYNF